MCGIVGTINKNKSIDYNNINNCLELINHRGPDDKGFWLSEDQHVALGNVRLAIIDLSSNGHMPMHDSSDKVHLAYNGEIYNYQEIRQKLISKNYQFKSETDTEVILNAYLEWGEGFIDKMDGMFAIAIYDQRLNNLFLYRDRAGEKPLYYYHNNGHFIFGSEMRLLLSDESIEKNLDRQSLVEYLSYGYCDNDSTLIEGVKKLKAGHKLNLDINTFQIKIETFWKLPDFNFNSEPPEYLAEKLNTLLQTSIKKQLVSDVPIGVLLSGGLDSSLVTGLAAMNSSKQLKTFHIHFDGLKQYDEKKYADIVAGHFNTDHYTLSGSELDEATLDLVLQNMDEPLADSSLLPTYLVSKLTRNFVTVALGGDGCDELFGGYSNYQQLLNFNPSNGIRNNVYKSISNLMPLGLKGKQFAYTRSRTNADDYITRSNFFNHSELKKVLDSNLFKSIRSLSPFFDQTLKGYDEINKITRYDFKHYMCDDVLVKVDRMSMLNSLEIRAPWLDRSIIEFAFGEVPSHLKTTKTEKKILPKLVAKNILPKELDVNRKQGFSIPLDQWMAGKWKHYFEGIFKNSPDKLFNKNQLLTMLNNESSKYFNNSHRLFAIASLLVWIKKYNVRLS